MGQYRQWLYHREVDQQLCTELADLEKELADLQEQIFLLATPVSYTDNVIIQALVKHYMVEEPLQADVPVTPVQQVTLPPMTSDPGIVSPALFAWGRLPNLGLQDIQHQALNAEPQPAASSPSSGEASPHPEDTEALLDTQGDTAPQFALPWWLRNAIASSTNAQSTGPIDQQSIRTNRLVQRWLERWRHLEVETAQEEKPS